MSREIREGLLEEGATVSSKGKSIKARHGRDQQEAHDRRNRREWAWPDQEGVSLVRSQSLPFELRALGSYGELR